MDLFDLVIAKKLAGGGGGGGGGDLTTATANITVEGMEGINIAGLYEDNDYIVVAPMYVDSSCVIQVVLYKGKAEAYYYGTPSKISVTGNAEISEQTITITGDCAITIT